MTALQAVLESESAEDLRISDVPILTDSDRDHLVAELNRTDRDYGLPIYWVARCFAKLTRHRVPSLFRWQSARSPMRILPVVRRVSQVCCATTESAVVRA